MNRSSVSAVLPQATACCSMSPSRRASLGQLGLLSTSTMTRLTLLRSLVLILLWMGCMGRCSLTLVSLLLLFPSLFLMGGLAVQQSASPVLTGLREPWP